MSLLARQLYFEAVKVGDELPPLVKPPIDRVQIARYAGATGEFNPLSVDEVHARNAGFPSVIAPGMLAMGFAGELVVDWLRGARLRRFSCRFVKIVWPGDVITCRAKVVERRFGEPGAYLVDIDVSAENQRGELVVRGQVTAQLFYNGDDDARQRAGQPSLVITEAEEEARFAKLHPPPRKPAPRPQPTVAQPLPPSKVAPPARPAPAAKVAPVKVAPLAKAAPLARAAPLAKAASAVKVASAKAPPAAKGMATAKPAPARPASRPVAKPAPAARRLAPAMPAPGAPGKKAAPRARPAPHGGATGKTKARAAATRKPARSLPPAKPASRAGRSASGKKPSAKKRR